MVPKDLLHEGMGDGKHNLTTRIFGSLLSILRSTPDPAVHTATTETHAFCFLQCWLPSESLAAGWTCPEALELHKFFRLLEVHQGKVKGECFQLTWSTLTGWRRVISSIRHAAVHRIPHDRKTFLKMVRAAIKFSKCIAGFESSKRLCRIQKFVKTSLSAHRDHLARRLVLLPEAVRRVLQSIEDGFVSKVKQFLHAEFKST
ncbi:unnamed protein product [Penicillium nalgiovense]|nr:unnamed protein product [Penicillium nalgiovense]